MRSMVPLTVQANEHGGPPSSADAADVQRLQDAFNDRHRYLLKLLMAKTLKISTQADLKFFTMSLNFNRVYKGAE